jgi:hypothetical protein
MRLATLRSCSTRSRSRISCSRCAWATSAEPLPSLHSSTILPPTMRCMAIDVTSTSLPLGIRPKYCPRSWMLRQVMRVTTFSPLASWSSMMHRTSERAAICSATCCL